MQKIFVGNHVKIYTKLYKFRRICRIIPGNVGKSNSDKEGNHLLYRESFSISFTQIMAESLMSMAKSTLSMFPDKSIANNFAVNLLLNPT